MILVPCCQVKHNMLYLIKFDVISTEISMKPYFTSLNSLFSLLIFADHHLFCHVTLMDSMPECLVKGYILLSTYFKAKTRSNLPLSFLDLVTGEEILICELHHHLMTASYLDSSLQKCCRVKSGTWEIFCKH